jgi:serpin B
MNAGYMDDDDLQVLELPYNGEAERWSQPKDLSMVFLLPRKADGLPALEKKLSAENIDKWLGKLKYQDVDICLPKFKFESRLDMTKALGSMGITEAFKPGAADFSGMDGSREFFLGFVIHKACLEVNEEATEAAAASGEGSLVGAKPGIHADHPFIFLIRDIRTGLILFMGRVANPKE